jgi:hypothetical protein
MVVLYLFWAFLVNGNNIWVMCGRQPKIFVKWTPTAKNSDIGKTMRFLFGSQVRRTLFLIHMQPRSGGLCVCLRSGFSASGPFWACITLSMEQDASYFSLQISMRLSFCTIRKYSLFLIFLELYLNSKFIFYDL